MLFAPSPLAIALAIILSTAPYVLAVPHRTYHGKVLGRSDAVLEYYEQRHAHNSAPDVAAPAPNPSVTVHVVKTITVTPTPLRTPMPSNMQFHLPPGIPKPAGTKRPVDQKKTSSSSTGSKTASSTSGTSSVKPTNALLTSSNSSSASASASVSPSVIVIPLPSGSLTITVPTPALASSSVIAVSTSKANIAAIEESASSKIASLIAKDMSKTTASSAATSPTSSTNNGGKKATQSDSTTQTTTAHSSSMTTTATTTQGTKAVAATCSSGSSRKCCSAIHNDLKSVTKTLASLTSFNLNFLMPDTSVGLDCTDIDDNDTTPAGSVCWNIVSCCETNALTKLSSIYIGCVPVV